MAGQSLSSPQIDELYLWVYYKLSRYVHTTVVQHTLNCPYTHYMSAVYTAHYYDRYVDCPYTYTYNYYKSAVYTFTNYDRCGCSVQCSVHFHKLIGVGAVYSAVYTFVLHTTMIGVGAVYTIL